ncbi:hypothetical protein G5B30_15275 [Sphingobacterium sp. SGG-5]|uniref:DUF6492 family protein n=1 Tax=Sphingobacterium sp. SGG-5 TaxID=2710881 RepID=UPI0013EDE1B6|nr:DUF6492 family protein [Sphingobacterium sp. SGG-5]NGM63269.1 hypothetical protein [Sphingobacterium sp. SGG-5]
MIHLNYDIVICVGEQHLDIVQTSILYIKKYLTPQKIIVITNKKHFHRFDNLTKNLNNLLFVDENTLNPYITFNTIAEIIEKKTASTDRTGWYFQQFLKMEICKIVSSDHYLIWDADTIPLSHIYFFEKAMSKVLVQPSNEYHIPYFNTLKKILNIEKSCTNSFISEHFMVSKEIMLSLIKKLEGRNNTLHWSQYILSQIDIKDLLLSGFSEYETYGNYILQYFPDTIKIRSAKNKLKSYRFGAELFGSLPTRTSLFFLKKSGYHYVTFEVWNKGSLKQIRKNEALAKLFLLLNNSILFSWMGFFIRRKISRQIKT